jgi:hypothetical protein
LSLQDIYKTRRIVLAQQKDEMLQYVGKEDIIAFPVLARSVILPVLSIPHHREPSEYLLESLHAIHTLPHDTQLSVAPMVDVNSVTAFICGQPLRRDGEEY